MRFLSAHYYNINMKLSQESQQLLEFYHGLSSFERSRLPVRSTSLWVQHLESWVKSALSEQIFQPPVVSTTSHGMDM